MKLTLRFTLIKQKKYYLRLINVSDTYNIKRQCEKNLKNGNLFNHTFV